MKNTGQVPSYFVEQSHPAIIDPVTFEMVQSEAARRKREGGRYSGVSIFSGKIKCGECGGFFGAKVWHSTDKYRRTIYRCNDKFKSHCKTPHLTEDDIKEAFVRAVNQLIENKADVLDSITLLKERLTDTEDLEEERDRISTDLNLLADKIQQLIAENARVAQNQDDYDRNYNELVSRYEAAKTQYDKTCEAIQYRKARSRQMDSFIKELRNQDLIKEFDARLWGSLVDFITVYSKDDIRVTFKDGTEIRA
ncbi:recombinase zinc beta ribbon domain-containing protein [uncultured Dialister sp.]|uniref:recombinase zinc beta ribbon domain-containing protein n=1 Tax=uncultured Dialister sp. TaxID=278064 RepID=UPI00265F78A2|nr:recombinase zinc beta ribbon domain-containing protein [uncultured Dialister sp.]